MRNGFDRLEQGYIDVNEYEACLYSLSRYSYASISTKSEKIQKFVKGLDVSLRLTMS